MNNTIKTSIIFMLAGIAISGILFLATSATTVEKSNSESIDVLLEQVHLMEQHVEQLEKLEVSTTVRDEPYMGEIVLFAGNFAPRGWMKCEGQILPIAQNNALFSLLGTIYGGDGRTTLALPDFRGRTAIHQNRPKHSLGRTGTMYSKIMNHGADKIEDDIFTKGNEGYVTLNYIIATEGLYPSRN